ncbi:unnamed protein product [Ostreobium quekettii]|uniref:Uncharacterized protein n=1 Tax=Ostreobium quekettii TaxID=121088 RepID=A0A8S1J124_9CHLO|nr:unnamed protein product [Ostreobium quekettii]
MVVCGWVHHIGQMCFQYFMCACSYFIAGERLALLSGGCDVSHAALPFDTMNGRLLTRWEVRSSTLFSAGCLILCAKFLISFLIGTGVQCGPMALPIGHLLRLG